MIARAQRYDLRPWPRRALAALGAARAKARTQATLEAARDWATKPTRAIAAGKKALNIGFGLPVSEGLLIERDAFNESFKTEDAREGVAAFIAKREADFKGR